MNSLILLKDLLQKTLNDQPLLVNYREALLDGFYSCQFETGTALEQWIAIWIQTDSHCLTETEMHYQKGVQFVSDTWQEVKENNQE